MVTYGRIYTSFLLEEKEGTKAMDGRKDFASFTASGKIVLNNSENMDYFLYANYAMLSITNYTHKH